MARKSTLKCRKLPLEFFTQKLECEEPFSSLLYGDGEMLVLLGLRNKQEFTHYREKVSHRMVHELRESLFVEGDNIYRGSADSLFDPLGGQLESLIRERGKVVEFVDGEFWDERVRLGELGPLLKILHDRETVVVGHKDLASAKFLHPSLFVPVPPRDAYGSIDTLEFELLRWGKPSIYVMCMGLGAIPLIMRLRGKIPEATYLDLGSVLDVFVGLGDERGWRKELYSNRDASALTDLRRRNLDGVLCDQCRE